MVIAFEHLRVVFMLDVVALGLAFSRWYCASRSFRCSFFSTKSAQILCRVAKLVLAPIHKGPSRWLLVAN